MNFSSIIELKFALKTKQSIYIVPGCNLWISYTYYSYKSWIFSGRNEYFFRSSMGQLMTNFERRMSHALFTKSSN